MNSSLRFKLACHLASSDHRICYDVGSTELRNGPLGDLCRWTGHEDIVSVLNHWNAWGIRVSDVTYMLSQPVDGEEAINDI